MSSPYFYRERWLPWGKNGLQFHIGVQRAWYVANKWSDRKGIWALLYVQGRPRHQLGPFKTLAQAKRAINTLPQAHQAHIAQLTRLRDDLNQELRRMKSVTQALGL